MWFNYFKSAWRNFLKYRSFNVINISGLSLGISTCLLIAFHIQDELSYEKSFPKHNQLYRVHVGGWAKSSPPMAEELKNYFPEIRSVARLYDLSPSILSHGDFQALEAGGAYADSSFLTQLDLQFISGKSAGALNIPYTIILTERLAKKYFQEEDAVGKLIQMNNRREFTVTGVIKDFPDNTHFKISFIISMPTLHKQISDNWTQSRGWMGSYTYVQVDSKESLVSIKEKMDGFILKFYEGWGTDAELLKNNKLEWQPITDIHLRSNLRQELSENSSILYLYIFATVALLVLLVACVNFINMNLSLAFKRIKETGVRKVLGAAKPQLVKQYFSESLLQTTLASVLAIMILQASFPLYNHLTGKSGGSLQLLDFNGIVFIVLLVIFISVVSGLYPALNMSSFTPIRALKEDKDPTSSSSRIKRVLMTLQYIVAVFMIASTLLVYRQVQYFSKKDLGFDKENVLAVKLLGTLGEEFIKNPETFKSELLKNTAIQQAGVASDLPGEVSSVEEIIPQDLSPEEAKQIPGFLLTRGDAGLLKTLRMNIIDGRDFTEGMNDSASYIINETAAKVLRLTDPVGKLINHPTRDKKGVIVGVVKDYHFTSLHNKIEPLAIEYNPERAWYLLLKVSSDNMPQTISYVEQTLKRLVPDSLFQYTFVDDFWNSLYRREEKMMTLFNLFSVLSIVISCIGLFGLSALAIEVKRKEIGIRKVFGASVRHLFSILSGEFAIVVLIGALVAVPVCWYAMNKWLQNFAYSIDVDAWIFIVASIVALFVSMVTVSLNVIKAAIANPVDSLRSE